MAGVGGQLDGGRELAELEQSNPALGRLVRRIIDGVNTTAQNAAVSPSGETKAPTSPASVTYSVAGEYLHLSVNHPGEVDRGVNYITTIHSDDPATSKSPIVYHHGQSRTPPPIPLPTNRPGPVAINYSIQTVAQYPSSQPSSPVIGRHLTTGATTFTMAGATAMNLLPGNGAGSSPNSGQQVGSGFGKVQKRGS